MPSVVTLEEAGRALPDIERGIRRLRRLREEAISLRARLEVLWPGLERGEASLEEIGERQKELDGLQEEFAALVREVEHRGGIVRDLDLGLVDFPALSGDVLIFLCWKVGEESIGFWHGVNEGYAGRKPLSVLPGLRRH